MLWFQTWHNKSSFLFPFLSRVLGFVSSHYWFGLICFPLKGSQQSSGSHLFSVSHPSPRSSVSPATPRTWNISSVTGVLRQSPLSRSPPGPSERREERRKEYNWLSLLYSGTSTLINIREQRHQWHFRWLPSVLRELDCGFFFFAIACSQHLLGLTHS